GVHRGARRSRPAARARARLRDLVRRHLHARRRGLLPGHGRERAGVLDRRAVLGGAGRVCGVLAARAWRLQDTDGAAARRQSAAPGLGLVSTLTCGWLCGTSISPRDASVYPASLHYCVRAEANSDGSQEARANAGLEVLVLRVLQFEKQ